MDVVRTGRAGEDQEKLEKNWPFDPPQREYNKDMGCKGKGKPKPKPGKRYENLAKLLPKGK